MQSVLNEGNPLLDMVSKELKSVSDKRNKNRKTYLNGSISRYSKNLIMSFPVICDNTLPIDTAQMVSKAHEKNLATMFEMLFSAMSLDGDNGVEILKLIHKDLNSGKLSINDVIDSIEQLVGESTLTYKDKAVINDAIREMVAELKTPQKAFPAESLNERSVNDFIVHNIYGKIMVKENKVLKEVQEDPNVTSERERRYAMKKNATDTTTVGYDNNKANVEAEKNERERRKDERDEEKRAEEREKRAEEKGRRSEERTKNQLDIAFKSLPQTKDIDYKKANELQPTVLIVNFNSIQYNEDGEKIGVEKKSFLAGIKSRMVGCDAIRIVERLSEKQKSKLTFKDFLRATTGEIKFVKDFLLNLKSVKSSALADARSGEDAKMWKLLEKRANKNASSRVTNSNDASPISTLVLSQSTVDFLNASQGVDLLNIKTATYMMEMFNLLAIVICDEISESAKFLYDGNTDYDVYSYQVLTREKSDKKQIDLMQAVMKAAGR